MCLVNEPYVAVTEEAEVDQLRRRLEETEKAMERIVAQMDNVSDRLSPSLVADLLAQPPSPNHEKVRRASDLIGRFEGGGGVLNFL